MTTAAHPIADLPELARTLLLRAGARDPGTLHLTRLRVKPGRGLTALLAPDSGAPVWLRLDGSAASVETAGADAALPALAAALAPRPGASPWPELEHGARLLLGDAHALLRAADATAVRHKPGSRCVVGYDLTVTSRGRAVRAGVFGKLFADRATATAADTLLTALHAEQSAAGRPSVPRPLGTAEPLGLALTAAVAEEGTRTVSGTEMLRCTAGGVPAEALAAAATALASLHRSTVRPCGERGDVAAVATRVDLLAAHAPGLASRIRAAGDELARLLATARMPLTPVHGGFKPSQLVYTDPGRVVVTDFDGIRLDDPALDVGYFLAYLRPASLWRGRATSREWFTTSARVFTTAYARSMASAGAEACEVAGILRRAPLHEAAALLKIAGRRPHRCNAPRPRELAAMLDEVEGGIALAGPATHAAAA